MSYQEVRVGERSEPDGPGVQLPDITPDIAEELLEDWLNIADGPDQPAPEPSPERFTNDAPPQPREIVFEGVLRINGYAAGVIRSSEGSLIVDPDGELDAEISVHDATIYGCVRGDIRATRTVELGGSARVVGDIETVALSIEPGAVFEGRCIFLEASPAANSSIKPDSEVTS